MCSTHGRDEKCILVRKPEGKGPHNRSRLRLKGNFEVNLEEKVYDVMNWIDIIDNRNQQKTVADTAMNGHIPQEE
jgi:hypothetical protein